MQGLLNIPSQEFFDSFPIREIQQNNADCEFERPASTTQEFTPWTSRLFGESAKKFETTNLKKRDFFEKNFPIISDIIDAINDYLSLSSDQKLSSIESLAVCNAEIGLKGNGTVDSKYDHGAGEHGLLPLSSIHKAVTGSTAPDPGLLYEPHINFEEFLLYLGALRILGAYRSIYNYPGIPGKARNLAHTAAASVHGYFYSPNYNPRSSKPSNKKILDIIVNQEDLGEFMSNTTFKAAWAVKARMSNIRQGIELAQELEEG